MSEFLKDKLKGFWGLNAVKSFLPENPSGGDTLVYNSTSGEWEAGTQKANPRLLLEFSTGSPQNAIIHENTFTDENGEIVVPVITNVGVGMAKIELPKSGVSFTNTNVQVTTQQAAIKSYYAYIDDLNTVAIAGEDATAPRNGMYYMVIEKLGE